MMNVKNKNVIKFQYDNLNKNVQYEFLPDKSGMTIF